MFSSSILSLSISPSAWLGLCCATLAVIIGQSILKDIQGIALLRRAFAGGIGFAVCSLLLLVDFSAKAQAVPVIATHIGNDLSGAPSVLVASLDIKKGAQEAKKASDVLVEDLEETKEKVGQTDTHKDAIDYGHNRASRKLEELSKSAQSAQTTDDLDPVEKTVLENLQ